MAFSDTNNGGNLSLNNIVKATSATNLVNILKSIPGRKDLILENDTTVILDQIISLSTLKSADVDKIYKLEAGPSQGNTTRCVYLVRPTLKTTRLIIEQIRVDRQKGSKNRYWIIYFPRKLYICEMLLEQEGVFENITIKEFPLGLIPLDTDLFSLEAPDYFSSFYIDGDYTWVPTIASSLVDLQKICGQFEYIYGHGRCAKMVFELMSKLKNETSFPDTKPLINSIILIDRDSDYASVLLTQMTYEGLLDETFGIKAGKVQLGEDVTGSDKPVKLILNSSDPVFLEIRDNHFSTVFNILKEKAHHLKSKHNERQGMQITDLKKFVATDLKDVQQLHRSLSLHIGASEVIMTKKAEEFEQLLMTEQALLEDLNTKECIAFIEECIIRQEPYLNSLRLLCLLSITQEGLNQKDYRSLISLFLQSYGHHHIITIHTLKKLGLLKEQTASNTAPNMSSVATANKLAGKFMAAVALRKSSFTMMAKKLGLIPMAEDNYNYLYPPNAGYVFSGTYIPLVCRIAEQALQREFGWSKLEENLKGLPCDTFKYHENIPGRRSSSANSSLIEDQSSKTFLVYFLGGATFAEIAALRFLGKKKGYTFLIATTSLISCRTLLGDFVQCSD